jgi:hypothetical protein
VLNFPDALFHPELLRVEEPRSLWIRLRRLEDIGALPFALREDDLQPGILPRKLNKVQGLTSAATF